MLKRNSIIKFILITIIAVLGILLCVCPFSLPYNSDVYNGIIPAINKGADLNGGITAIYNCTLPSGSGEGLSKSIDDSLLKVEEMFETEKFSELEVTRHGGNKIYVLASGEYATEVNDAFAYMSEGKSLSFTTASVSDSQSNPEVYADSSVVYKAYPEYDYEAKTYGVKVEFTKNGIKELKELKSYAKSFSNDSIYLYLGDITKENTLAEIDVDDLGKESIFITASSTGSYSTSTADESREIAYSIISGSLDVELELLEISKISPVLGPNTKTLLSIALAVIVVAAFVCLIIKYRHLGLLACLALAFYLILFSFFMMALPFITLNLAGVIGSLVAFLIAVLATIFIFEKIKEEYAMGKKIHLSCKGGFKRALWTILDSHIVIIFVAIFVWVFAPAMLKIFGITMILGALLSMFTSLVILRIFVKNYLRINSSKAKKLGLYRDKNVREIKDEEVQIIEEDVAAKTLEGGSHE